MNMNKLNVQEQVTHIVKIKLEDLFKKHDIKLDEEC